MEDVRYLEVWNSDGDMRKVHPPTPEHDRIIAARPLEEMAALPNLAELLSAQRAADEALAKRIAEGSQPTK